MGLERSDAREPKTLFLGKGPPGGEFVIATHEIACKP